MRPSEFSDDYPGRLVRSIEGFWTFEPAPLPPSISFSASLTGRIAAAERALGELAGVGHLLPNAFLLISPFIRREAVLSSRIEGTVTRLDELLRYEIEPEDSRNDSHDEREVLNYVTALDHGLTRLGEGMPLCLRLLREMHACLMDEVRGSDKRPGEFRDGPVLIGRRGQSFDEARYVPPHHTAIDPLLNDFEKFLNTPGDLPIVVQMAIAHYQFEAIHPFADGNGRLGRLLMTLLLCERCILPQPLLYLSAYLEAHNDKYRDHLLSISQRGSWEEWLAFFAIGVGEQSADAVLRARRLLDLQEVYRERMRTASQSSTVVRLSDQLFASPYITIPGAAKFLGVTQRTADQNVKKLIEHDILQEVDPGRKRNRVYYAAEILELLSADRMTP